MNYISELAYARHIAQTTKSARDKRQKNKYQHSELIASDDEQAQVASDNVVSLENNSCWEGKERREGIDRREMLINRGRYLESRAIKDRRYNAKVSVKI